MRRVCLTVDLDPVDAYHRIHGLPPAASAYRHHLSRVALPRFLALFDRIGARATFFVVGEDLADPDVARLLSEAVAAGHELANHTEHHPYDFLDRPRAEHRAEVGRCHERLASLVGAAPVGFRSPGYHTNRATLRLLHDLGYHYDSSVLPSAPYWLAKAAVMASLRVRGRPSRARLHAPTDLLAPRSPYEVATTRPWRPGSGPLLEIPAASLVLGVPLVGTFLGALPTGMATALGATLRRRPFVTVEFHAIDLVDRTDGGLDALVPHQPGLDTDWSHRLATFEALLVRLCPGAHAVPLRELR